MNIFEQQVKNTFEEKGWEVLRGGWPDFLLIKRNHSNSIKSIIAVEAKSKKDILSERQIKILGVLSTIIPTFVAREGCGYGKDINGFHLLTRYSLSNQIITLPIINPEELYA